MLGMFPSAKVCCASYFKPLPSYFTWNIALISSFKTSTSWKSILQCSWFHRISLWWSIFLWCSHIDLYQGETKHSVFLPEQAFEGLQWRRWSLLPVGGLRKSPSRPKQNHPELFRFNCWFERCRPRSRILFCLIRCDCIGPSQSQCLFI